MRPQPWDEYETALLIDAYQQIKEKKKDKKTVLSILSCDLRRLGDIRGIKLDNTFRNINGMYWQFGYIEKAFQNKDYNDRSQTAVFKKMVDIYNNNNSEYLNVLNKAKAMLKNNEEKETRKNFAKWLLENGEKEDYSKQILYTMEEVMNECTNIDIWEIKNVSLYEFICKGIEKNYKYKNKNRTKYLDFVKNKNKYNQYLKENENDLIINSAKPSKEIEGKNSEEIKSIRDFFNIKKHSEVFINAFLYSKNLIPDIKLDVRSTIVGVRVGEEQLRYYAHKNGEFKIKISDKGRYVTELVELGEEIYQLIDICNKYFEKSKNELLIGSVETSESKETNTINDDTMSISMLETDFYSFIKEGYLANHKTDGKRKLAPKHAQKSIQILRKLDEILEEQLNNKKILEVTDINETKHLYKYIKTQENKIEKQEYNWYLYVLRRFESFLKQEKQKENIATVIKVEKVDCKNNEYTKIIEDYFPDGFLYENILRRKKFEQLYENTYNKKFTDCYAEYQIKMWNAGFECDGKIYPASIISTELHNEIVYEIEKIISSDTTAVYYTPLFLMFEDKLNRLFNEKMFIEYLRFTIKNKYEPKEDYVWKKGEDFDLKDYIARTFINRSEALSIDELQNTLPHVSIKAIEEVLKDKEFIVNQRGKSYFYYKIFEVTEKQLDKIEEYIDLRIKENSQTNGAEIYKFINKNLPEIIDSNPSITDLGIKNVLKKHLGNKFNFNGDVIGAYGTQLDVKTLYANYCKEREEFTIHELDEYKDKIQKTYIDYDAIFENAVRVNKEKFVRKDKIDFDIETIDKAIDAYSNNKYISFVEIKNYNDFPSMRYPWNEYLLESYVYCYSDKFCVLHTMFNKEKPVGAIVNKNSSIRTFEDLVIDVLRTNKIFEKDLALNYLIENSYMLTRKFKNINLIIDKAKEREA